MKKVLITGINGSGASYLVDYLRTVPDVIIFGIARKSDPKSTTCTYICDLMDLGGIIRVLEKSFPDYIFHLASNANVRLSFENPISIFNNNVNATLNLLEAIRILKIKPVVHLAGTSEVYGQVSQEDIPIKESQKIDPINVYAISKLAQEKLCKSYWLSYQIPVVLTRAFSYINPKRADIFSSSFARQVVEIERGRAKKLIHGNLHSIRTIIDVRDIVEAYWIAANKCEYGKEYNIGGGSVITVGEFLEELVKYADCKITLEQDPSLLRPVDVTLQIPDVTRFTNQTGWKPKYTLKESIKFLLDYYRGSA